MNHWLQSVNQKMRSQGRNGIDEFCRFLFLMGLSCIILVFFDFLRVLVLFAPIPTIWSLIRCRSKRLEKREIENEAYLAVAEQIKESFVLVWRRWADRKTYRYYRCPDCNTIIRLRKGAGKVRVACPECDCVIIKKT